MKFKVLLAACIAVCTSCTGYNYGQYLMVATANTNPMPEYSSPYRNYYTGGAIFHRNGAPGPVGNANAKLNGRSCAQSVLWLVAWGDASVEAAKNAGSIKKVAAVEYEQTAVLGFVYHRFCTIVVGE